MRAWKPIAFAVVSIFCIVLSTARIQAQVAAQLSASAGRMPTSSELRRLETQRRNAAKPKHPVAAAILKALTRTSNVSTVPPAAPFLGNLTKLEVSDLLSLVRLPDCTLDEANSTFQAFGGTFQFTVEQDTPDFERTLHKNAFLASTSDQFSNGCDDSPVGLYSRLSMYVGKTSTGDFVQAVAVGTAALESTRKIAVFVLTPKGTLKSMTNYATDGDPNTLAVGDLNGDGWNDIVAVSRTAITVFLGSAEGTFRPGIQYKLPSGVTPSTIAIDDVTGDDKPDVLVAEDVSPAPTCTSDCNNSFRIAIYPGKGDGALEAPKNVTALGPPNYLITANLRGKGLKDIVTGVGEVFLNNGTGTFKALPGFAFPFENLPGESVNGSAFDLPLGLAAGDFNGDGKLDLALADGSVDAVRIFLGKGDGTFTVGGSYAVADLADIDVTDLDGDGNKDIYVGLGNNFGFGGEIVSMSSSYALMGKGDGAFQGAAALPFYAFGPQQEYDSVSSLFDEIGASSGNILDLNGDKKPDAVGISQNTSSGLLAFTSYLGKGDGTFETGPSLDVAAPFTYKQFQLQLNGITSYALADFNGDKIPDLVYTGEISPNGNNQAFGYFIALGKGDGSFETPILTVPSFFPSGVLANGIPQITNVSTADFNHDGKADLIYYAYAGGLQNAKDIYVQSAFVQLGKGDGTFETPIQVALSGGINPATSMALPLTFPALIQDINGDGYPDLIVQQLSGKSEMVNGSNVSLNQLAVYLGKGNGTFEAPRIITAADDPQSPLLLADLNGDGKLDLISTGMNSQGLTELATSLCKGDGTFDPPTIYLPKSYITTGNGNLAAADFNGDGKQDVVFNDGVFLGNGDGTLQVTSSNGYSAPTQTLSFLQYGANSVAADFNGDGRIDLLNGSNLLLNEYGVTVPALGATVTTVSVAPDPATPTEKITFTAKVVAKPGESGTPAGTVTFYNGSTSLGTATLASGVATLTKSSLAAGEYSIEAKYSGDSAFSASTSAAVALKVAASEVATRTTLGASPTKLAAGGKLTLTAVVAPASGSVVPTGYVEFLSGTTKLGTGTLSGSGHATFETTALTAGTHAITAEFLGDSKFKASTSAVVDVTVTAATTNSAQSD